MDRQELVDYILKCFEDMGAKVEDLTCEREKLQRDDGYLADWLKTVQKLQNG